MREFQFYPVDREAMDRFLQACRRHQYPARTIVMRPGDPGQSMFYVVEGSVTVSTEGEDGRELILGYLNPGDFIGEMGLFMKPRPREVLVRTRTRCELAEISYIRLRELLEGELKDVATEIMSALGSKLAQRLLQTRRKVYHLAFLDTQGRVARTLIDLCGEPDAVEEPLVDALLADTGYHSQDNLDHCEAAGVEPYIAEARQRHNPPLAERLAEHVGAHLAVAAAGTGDVEHGLAHVAGADVAVAEAGEQQADQAGAGAHIEDRRGVPRQVAPDHAGDEAGRLVAHRHDVAVVLLGPLGVALAELGDVAGGIYLVQEVLAGSGHRDLRCGDARGAQARQRSAERATGRARRPLP